MRLDLHGLTVEESTSEIMVALLSFDNSPYEQELEIITGKGAGTLMFATLNILEEEGRQYQQLEGRIIVYKKEKDNDLNWANLMEELEKDND